MINQELQIQLRDKYNPDGSPLRNHQLRMLEILKYVDIVCKENGIQYWLSSGSCLGAIRHGGFIPWDDDIDIEMMRKDFLKFQKLFKESDKYVLQTRFNDRFYPTPFHKVREKNTFIYDSLYKYRGIFIDVLCMEYTNRSVSVVMSILYSKLLNAYDMCKSFKTNNGKNSFLFDTIFTIAKKLFYITVPVVRFVSKILPHKKLRHTYGIGWVDNIREEKEIFPLTTISFEGLELPVPGNYDAYLKRMFGNYMTIPPEDKIQKPHVQYFQE